MEEYCIRRGTPEILAQWDTERNGAATPGDIPHSSREKVWWRCERGHSYQASVQSRAMTGSGCPICAGKAVLPGWNDLLSKRPEIAAEWDAERNAPLTPEAVTLGSGRRVWWHCAEGPSWQTAVFNRLSAGTGCPVCRARKTGADRRRFDAVLADRAPRCVSPSQDEAALNF